MSSVDDMFQDYMSFVDDIHHDFFLLKNIKKAASSGKQKKPEGHT